MNICEHLTATALLVPDRIAIRFGGTSLTYRELAAQSLAASNVLTEHGVRRGDRVALMLPNVPAFAVWYYAIARLGAIAVSISTRASGTEAAFLLDDSGSVAIIVLSDTVAQIQNDLPDCVKSTLVTNAGGTEVQEQPLQYDQHGTPSTEWVATERDDAAVILYTSGTTGFPKGATLSHANVRSNVHAFNHLCGMRMQDRILLTVPLFHCFGQNALLNSALNVGATLILQTGFDLNETKRLIVQEQVTQFYGVPMMFQLLLEHATPDDLQSIEYYFSAAAPLPLAVSLAWQEKFGIPICEGYGLTETSPFASYNHRFQYTPGSIGTPIDSVEMRIVDPESGAPCGVDEPGEIIIRGPNVMLGYWNRPGDTATAIRDGWFHSGDIGRQNTAGQFFIEDRVKDMISVGGLKVFPAEVERVLCAHPMIKEAAVVGLPDDVFGERVVGFVVPVDEDDFDLSKSAAVLESAKGQLSNYKTPQQLIPVDALPRNPTGKVLKRELRDERWPSFLAEAKTGEDAPALPSVAVAAASSEATSSLRHILAATYPSQQIEATNRYLRSLVQSIAGTDELPDSDARFLDVGFDSLMVVDLSQRIQNELGPGHVVSTTLVFDYPRICDLSEFVFAKIQESASASKAENAPTTTLTDGQQNLRETIHAMSEEDALEELRRELEDS